MRAPPRTGPGWLSALALLALAAVPLLGGAVRVRGLAAGGPVTPENARFVAAPVPVVVHIASASLFSVLGALQFVARFRRRSPGWHRLAGRLLTPLGLAAALSGLWMNQFSQLPPSDGALLYAFRLLFGSAMAACLVLGFAAIRRRDVRQHGAWMTRAYAIGLGAGTQALVLTPFSLDGPPGVLGRALLMGAGWALNLAFAEWVIRRDAPARPPPDRGLGAPGLAG